MGGVGGVSHHDQNRECQCSRELTKWDLTTEGFVKTRSVQKRAQIESQNRGPTDFVPQFVAKLIRPKGLAHFLGVCSDKPRFQYF